MTDEALPDEALPDEALIAEGPAVPVFDACGPLPAVETVVLEASAGTGKTWTIASLAVRYVAELDVRLPELLLVTFGRAATTELRDRVRSRLVEVERALRDEHARASSDDVIAHLADAAPAEVRTRRGRGAPPRGGAAPTPRGGPGCRSSSRAPSRTRRARSRSSASCSGSAPVRSSSRAAGTTTRGRPPRCATS